MRLPRLDQPGQHIAMFANLGVHTIGYWLSLPRDGLACRFGQRTLDEIDRALGLLPDPRPSFSPPAGYSASLRLPAPVQETQPLLFPPQRLVLAISRPRPP